MDEICSTEIIEQMSSKKHGCLNHIEGYATTLVYTTGIIIAHYGKPYETASLKRDAVQM